MKLLGWWNKHVSPNCLLFSFVAFHRERVGAEKKGCETCFVINDVHSSILYFSVHIFGIHFGCVLCFKLVPTHPPTLLFAL